MNKLQIFWYKKFRMKSLIEDLAKNGWDDKYEPVFTEPEIAKMKLIHVCQRDYSDLMQRIEDVASGKRTTVEEVVVPFNQTAEQRDKMNEVIRDFIEKSKEGVRP